MAVALPCGRLACAWTLPLCNREEGEACAQPRASSRRASYRYVDVWPHGRIDPVAWLRVLRTSASWVDVANHMSKVGSGCCAETQFRLARDAGACVRSPVAVRRLRRTP